MESVAERTVEAKFVTVRQAEKITGLSRWTLARAHDRGELPLYRVGTAVRYSVEDLDAFMRARRA